MRRKKVSVYVFEFVDFAIHIDVHKNNDNCWLT